MDSLLPFKVILSAKITAIAAIASGWACHHRRRPSPVSMRTHVRMDTGLGFVSLCLSLGPPLSPSGPGYISLCLPLGSPLYPSGPGLVSQGRAISVLKP